MSNLSEDDGCGVEKNNSVKAAIRLAVDLLFAIATVVMYGCFLYRDLTETGSGDGIKYAAILTVFAYALTNVYSEDGIMVAAALLFTVVADTFLLLLDSHYLFGVLAFCVVQALYFVRMIRLERYRRPWISAIVRVSVWLVVLAILRLTGMLDGLLCVTAFYFINLAVNAVESFRLCRKNRGMLLFAVGLLLFVCCDVCVGFNNLSQYLPVDSLQWLCDFAAVGMWAFYLPSQVLITFSVRTIRRKKHEA